MPLHLTCSVCGVSFTRRASHVRRFVYCSQACSKIGPPLPVPVYSGTTAMIPLTDRYSEVRGHVLVDAADAPFVCQWRWNLDHEGYATRGTSKAGQDKESIRLHRELLGLPRATDGREGDHINRDRLDCRRENLRVATTAQNLQNKGGYRGARSAYRGVDLWYGKWRARIRVSGKLIHLGYFVSEGDAAEAARTARARLMTHAVD
jgi:hypothetical protein